MKIIATKGEFDAQLASAGSQLVVVDFFATWCGPCVHIAPYLDELSKQYQDVIFVKVDVDKNSDTSEACGIRCMPTFQFYKNGSKVDQLEGASKGDLKAMVEKHK